MSSLAIPVISSNNPSLPASLQAASLLYSSFNLDQRTQELNARVQSLVDRIAPGSRLGTVIGSFSSDAAMPVERHFSTTFPFLELRPVGHIKLPSFCLLKYEDIPLQFRNDHCPNEEQFAAWVNTIHQPQQLPELNPSECTDILVKFLISLRDRDLFEKQKDFIIAHEICHTLVENLNPLLYFATDRMGEVSAFTLKIGLGIYTSLLLVSLGIISSAHWPLIFTSTIIGLAVIGVLRLVYWHSLRIRQQIEENCDMQAVRALNDARGGIYYFQNEIAAHIVLRRSIPSLASAIDHRGNALEDRYHPPLTARVAYLQQWQNQHAQS